MTGCGPLKVPPTPHSLCLTLDLQKLQLPCLGGDDARVLLLKVGTTGQQPLLV